MPTRSRFSTLIDAAMAAARHHDETWRWLDCRFRLDDPDAGRRAFWAGHIPGARYVHLDDDLSAPVIPEKTGRHPLPQPHDFAERVAGWGISNGDQVVVYDDMGGAIAARAWWMLRWVGHREVAVLDGGWPAWEATGGPVETGPPQKTARGNFEARADPDRIADAARTGSVARDPAWRVMDARKAERYAGDVEPIDAVGGHIPGAVSVPFPDNLDGGRMRGVEELRARFSAALGGVEPSRAVLYCGSGVTACHDLLAMEHAGLTGAKLYPGSWSEWITDARRPVGKGSDPG